MEIYTSYDNALNSFMEFDKCFKDFKEASKKKEQIELINDILDARESRKNCSETRAIVDQETFDTIKKHVRLKLYKEMEEYISQEMDLSVSECRPINYTIEKILRIIRGE